jgi:hypothetical protein
VNGAGERSLAVVKLPCGRAAAKHRTPAGVNIGQPRRVGATGNNPMNAKILITAVAALSLAGAGVANATHHGKRHKARHYAPVAAYVYVPPAPMAYGPRPIWAAPGSCWTDEGYGRYRPCDAGGGRGR